MIKKTKTEFSKKALAELTRRREIRELEFKLFCYNFPGRINNKRNV